MGTPLTGSTVASTYTGLLKTSDNASLTGSLRSISDGGGTDSALQLSTSAANIVGTLNVTGATGLASSLAVSGLATIGSTLGVTGATNLSSTLTVTGAISGASLSASGNLTVNGNTTIGNAAADLLTVNANVVTFPNITTQSVNAGTDKVVILDSSGNLRASNANQFVQTSSNSPQCKQTANKARASIEANTTGSGADVISVSITPRSGSSNILVSAVINYSFLTGDSKNCVFRLTRNGTEIGTSTGTGIVGIASASYEDGEIESINNVKIEFLDSPNTTSAVTYKIHIYGSNDLYLNFNISGSVQHSTTSTITAQEYFA